MVDPESESGATIFRAVPNNDDDTDNDNDDINSNNNKSQKIIVACRGSANPKNFGTNLKFNLVPANRLSQNYIPENALVHDGFQSASVGLWKELSQPLEKLLNNGDNDETTMEIVFTGHSLGAATALLCATHYNASHKNKHLPSSSSSSSSSMSPLSPPPPSIITFGGPKLCNSILARHLRKDALEGWNILHLVHSKDPVLANNQVLWEKLGFEDVGIELECDPNSPIVFDAEEKVPEKSLFGGFAWNIVDHCKYMGVFVGPRAFF